MANLPDPKYGIVVKPANAPPGSHYWRITEVYHLTGAENMGNHHAYCDVLDEEGNRVTGARLKLSQEGQPDVYAVIDKPANEAGTNFPLWSGNLADVTVVWPEAVPYHSDTVQGIRTTHPDEGIGNTWGHHSFLTTWQLTPAVSEPMPVPDWRKQLSGGELWLIKQYQGGASTPESRLVRKLVTILDTPPSERTRLALHLLEAHERDQPIEAYVMALRDEAG